MLEHYIKILELNKLGIFFKFMVTMLLRFLDSCLHRNDIFEKWPFLSFPRKWESISLETIKNSTMLFKEDTKLGRCL